MTIKELNIVEFGCLKNKKITLCDTLNIISGENESGKSTVMLFIKFMLYGLSRKSAKSSDRERSLSFDGHRAAGSMTVEHGGRLFKIERSAVGITRVSETLKMYDLATGEALDGEPCDLFLGVPAEVFESSCAISQSKVTDINKSGTSNAVENMLISADESIDVKKVLEKIDKVRKEYRLNKGDGGILFDTAQEISALKQKYRSSLDKHLQINEMNERLDRKDRELNLAERDIALAKEQLRLAKDAQILAQFDELEREKDALAHTLTELEALDRENSIDGVLPSEEYSASLGSAAQYLSESRTNLEEHKILAEKARKQALPSDPMCEVGERVEKLGGADIILRKARSYRKKSSSLLAVSIIFLVLACALTGAALILTNLAVRLICGATAVILMVAFAMLTIASIRAKGELKRLCDEYNTSFDELEAYLNAAVLALGAARAASIENATAQSRLEDAQKSHNAAYRRLASLLPSTYTFDADDEAALINAAKSEILRARSYKAGKQELTERIIRSRAKIEGAQKNLAPFDEQEIRARLDNVTQIKSVADCERSLNFSEVKKAQITKELGHIRESLAASRGAVFESPVEISDRIAVLDQRLAKDTEYFDALMLAKECIEQASERMSGNVTPKISGKASEMLALISGGKHKSVQTTKSFDLLVDEDGFGVPVEILSAGARDAAYICLRIALSLMLFGEELPPLMLDDALCQLDDNRAAKMLSVISRLTSMPLQCIIFTCHDRERLICERDGLEHCFEAMS